MSNVKVDVKKAETKVTKLLHDIVKSPSMLREIGEFSAKRIYSFTKSGKSLASPSKDTPVDSPVKLKELSAGYVKWRRKLGREEKARKKSAFAWMIPTKVGELFSAARSNLTLTGQMLRALTFKVNKEKRSVLVTVKDSARDGSDLTNLEVANKVAKEGRPFIGMDRKGRDLIRQMVIRQLRRKLRRK